MKVRELIKVLEKQNQEADVKIHDQEFELISADGIALDEDDDAFIVICDQCTLDAFSEE